MSDTDRLAADKARLGICPVCENLFRQDGHAYDCPLAAGVRVEDEGLLREARDCIGSDFGPPEVIDANQWPPVRRVDLLRRLNAALASPAPTEGLREQHQPGEAHRYDIICRVCGQRGTIRLSVEPEAPETVIERALGAESGRCTAIGPDGTRCLLPAGHDPLDFHRWETLP